MNSLGDALNGSSNDGVLKPASPCAIATSILKLPGENCFEIELEIEKSTVNKEKLKSP